MLIKARKVRWPGIHQPERRLHGRAGQPWLRLETEGFAYIVRDWSVGGVAIDHFHDAGPVGTLVTGKTGWADADNLAPFTADIVRREPDGSVALRWLDTPAELLADLDHTARHR